MKEKITNKDYFFKIILKKPLSTLNKIMHKLNNI